jgi:hypothetical protein
MRARGLVAWMTALAMGMLASPAHAQLYRWVNEQGEVHFTQGLENVPERFRGGARLLGYPEAAPAPAPIAPAGSPAATPEAPPPGVRGGARIPFTPGEPILLTVRVNGLRTVRLLLDTGAQSTLIHTRALAAIGVDPSGGRPISVMGVTGQAEGRYVGLESLEVGEARVAPLGVIAYDLLLREGDGLLGRDFLDRFKLTVDTEARVVILAPR